MRELRVEENDANQRLDKFLQKCLVDLPKSLMHKYIRNKKIKVNHKRCEASQKLQVGDVVVCYIAESFFERSEDLRFLQAQQPLRIVYEDQNILVMHKAIGTLCHSDDLEDIETLINQMKLYLYQQQAFDPKLEQSFTPALCNRLDRNSEGLVIGAKQASALREVNQLIKHHQLHKYYYAVVEGILQKDDIDLWHYHRRGDKIVVIQDTQKEGYKKVGLHYWIKKQMSHTALVEIELYTGRTHQIRAQFAHMHHPLVADYKYGAQKKANTYHALCAYKVVFEAPPSSPLAYLNAQSISIEQDNIDLLRKLK
ncbi:MAG: pseudouridine synthase [Breznakia sp.]